MGLLTFLIGKRCKREWKIDYDILATYNTEVSRGIVHTEKWRDKMSKIQKDYNNINSRPTLTSGAWIVTNWMGLNVF